MALEDFYGTWNVVNSAGTDFGIGARLDLSPRPREDGVQLDIVLKSAELGTWTLAGSYDSASDQVVFETQAQHWRLARYVDRSSADDYYLVYGAVIEPADEESRSRSRVALFAAEADGSRRLAAPAAATDPGFSGEYVVRSTSNAQFGVGSSVRIDTDSAAGTSTVAITNALFGEEIPGPDQYHFDGATGSLRGESKLDDGTPLVVQVSSAELDGRRFVFGVSLLGDPEQTGTWGAEDEGSTPVADDIA